MNIFLLDEDPKKCAEQHTDKHVVKMILESVQMMSSAVRIAGIDSGYRLTHKNHPCSIWVRKSLSNYNWLKQLVEELNAEYKYRYGKDINHKSYDVMKTLPEPNIPDIGLTEFALAMPEKYKNDNAVVAYRNYYKGEKKHLFSWKMRKTPEWA